MIDIVIHGFAAAGVLAFVATGLIGVALLLGYQYRRPLRAALAPLFAPETPPPLPLREQRTTESEVALAIPNPEPVPAPNNERTVSNVGRRKLPGDL